MMKAARLWTVAVLAGMLLGAAACQSPSGTDGDLVDDWRPLVAPTFDLPAVGTCLDSRARLPFDPRFYRSTPVACDHMHALEVVLVGNVQGSAAAAAEPPAAGTEAFQAAYSTCSKAVGEYAGGDWHDGLLGIEVQMPTKTPWAAGQHAFVCSVYGIATAYGTMAFRAGSLKDSLAGAATSAMHCLGVVADEASDGWYEHLTALTPIDCAKPHGAEYAGSVQLTGAALPPDNVLERTTLDLCWAMSARFVGLTQDQLSRRNDIRVTWDGMDQQHWQSGDHYQRCFVMVPYKQKVHATLKNLRSAKLPT